MEKSKMELFLKSCRSKSTRKTYRRGIEIYMRYIYDECKDDIQDLVDRYLKDERNYRNDLISFIDHMEEKYAPKSINVYISGIKEFMIYNDIEFSMADIRQIKRKNPRPEKISQDKPITIDILHRIVDHMNTTCGKALVLFISSSGCRIGEALSISMNDIDMTQNPPRVLIRGTNTKNQGNRLTFISSEAKKTIEEWIDIRKENLEKKKKKYRYLKIDIDDHRLFPLSSRTVYALWNTSLRRSGLDKEIDQRTGRNLYTFHGLRRFFKTRLTGHLESEAVEKLMGHEGYLNGSYYRVSDDEMASKYLKVMNRLEIRSVDNSVSRFEDMDEKIDTLETKNKWLIEIIDKMKKESNTTMKWVRDLKESFDSQIKSKDEEIQMLRKEKNK